MCPPHILDNVKGREAGIKILYMMKSDPRHTTEKFRELFKQQQSSPIPLEQYANPDVGVDHLLTSLPLWVNAGCELFASVLDGRSTLQEQHVEAFAEAGGLLDLYQDMLISPGIFLKNKAIYHDVVGGLSAAITTLQKRSTLPYLQARAPEIWAYIWQHKTQFTQRRLQTLVDMNDEGTDSVAIQPVVALLQAYQAYFKSIKWIPRIVSHIHHLVLYMWATYVGRTDDLLKDIVSDLLMFVTNVVDEPGRADSVETLLAEAVVGTVGIDLFLSRTISVLRDARASLNVDLLRVCTGLLVLLTMGNTLDIMPYLSRNHIMNIIISTIVDSRSENGATSLLVYYYGCPLFRRTTEYYLTHDVMITRGEDVIAFFSACLDTSLAYKCGSQAHAEILSPAVALLEEDMLERMQDYYSLARSFNDSPSVDTPLAVLVHGMQAGARTHWYPPLVRLRKAKPPKASDKAHVQSLRDLWKGFGAVLGLNPKEEQRRHIEEARAGCSWRNCPLRGQSIDDRQPLRKCAGCGELSYCGRECQSRDWKHGGHKTRCGKRLKT